MDTSIFLGGKEPTTLKELAAVLGKETIDLSLIHILQALCLSAFDTLHTALPFFSSLALLLSLPLALADAVRHKVAGFPEAWHNGLPPVSYTHLTGWSFDWNHPSMKYLYHRTFLCPVPYIHKVGIKGKNQKFPRLRKVGYNPDKRQQ